MARNYATASPMEYKLSKTEIQKNLIVSALRGKSLSSDDDYSQLADCVETGKVSINGCVNLSEPTNKALMDIAQRAKPTSEMSATELREFIGHLQAVLKIEARTKASLARVNANFYRDLSNTVEVARWS